MVRPEKFASLMTGGPNNTYTVEGYLHRQGDTVLHGQNHVKTEFFQFYRLPTP
jgi:hypothetical protein